MTQEQLLKNYQRDLTLKGFSRRTCDIYCHGVLDFLKYTNGEIENTDSEKIKNYLYHLITDRDLSDSSIRQARSSIKYLFAQTLNRTIEVENIPCRIKQKRIPTALSLEEVSRIINSTENIKHKTMLMLIYSSGLRVGEIVELEPSDIRRDIMRLKVRQGKGHRDRYTILSKTCLEQLEIYWKQYRPSRWLFNGRTRGTQISIRAVQHAFEKAKRIAGITKECGIHSLRHSFATHMLESGGGLFQLQKFLGHKHLQTTLVYAHICEERIIARSPLDVYREIFLNAKPQSNH